MEVVMVPLQDIKPHPRNPNIHTIEQIERLAKIIEYQGFREPVTISNQSGWLNSGHGRYEAAKLLNLTHIPAIYQDFKDQDQEMAHMISNNTIAKWSKISMPMVNQQIQCFDGNTFDLDNLGFKDFSLDPFPKDVQPKVCPKCGHEL